MTQEYVSIPIEVDRAQLRENAYDALRARFPGWEPAAPSLDTWLIAACADLAGDEAEAAVDAPAEIFRAFGEKIAKIPPILAAPASAPTTWTMVDDAGYTIRAGTFVQIEISGSTAIAFKVLEEVLVPPGETTTGAGEVVIVAAVPGTAANNLETDPVRLDSLTFVEAIALESVTSGGVDEEDPLDYLGRLVEVLRLQSPRPILPDDAAVLARTVGGVYRATAIDLYDPVTETFDNERTVTVAVVDEDGAALAAPVKTAVEELLAAEREINFIFHVIDPTFTAVDADVVVAVLAGFDEATVLAAVEAALASYLTPANWGLSPSGSNPREWRNVPTVRINEAISLVDRVAGVDYVESLELDGGTANVTLPGPAPLPEPGTIAATAA